MRVKRLRHFLGAAALVLVLGAAAMPAEAGFRIYISFGGHSSLRSHHGGGYYRTRTRYRRNRYRRRRGYYRPAYRTYYYRRGSCR